MGYIPGEMGISWRNRDKLLIKMGISWRNGDNLSKMGISWLDSGLK
jgi:hypothetical protein